MRPADTNPPLPFPASSRFGEQLTSSRCDHSKFCDRDCFRPCHRVPQCHGGEGPTMMCSHEHSRLCSHLRGAMRDQGEREDTGSGIWWIQDSVLVRRLIELDLTHGSMPHDAVVRRARQIVREYGDHDLGYVPDRLLELMSVLGRSVSVLPIRERARGVLGAVCSMLSHETWLTKKGVRYLIIRGP
jgi:hypothetical protein